MKYAGKAKRAGFRLLSFSLLATFVLWAIGALAAHVAGFSVLIITVALGALWVVFALFTCNFFRDPDARPQTGANIVVSPAHGKVDVIGVSKGRGFAGVVKRHHFRGGGGSHGSMFHRAPGSIGASSFPSRVVPGMRMGGRMGTDNVTVRNLEIVEVDVEDNVILVKGAVPGPNGGYVVLRRSRQ